MKRAGAMILHASQNRAKRSIGPFPLLWLLAFIAACTFTVHVVIDVTVSKIPDPSLQFKGQEL